VEAEYAHVEELQEAFYHRCRLDVSLAADVILAADVTFPLTVAVWVLPHHRLIIFTG